MWSWWWVASAWASTCPEPVPVLRLDERLVSAERAFSELDVARFHAAVDEAVLALPCVDAVVSPSLAAHYHRVIGLRQFVAREREAARASFAAARVADPAGVFPAEVLPDGHGAKDLFSSAPTASVAASIPVARPSSGTLVFDGLEANARPSDRPSIVQVVAVSGAPSSTRWLSPGEPMPSYEAVALAPTPVPLPLAPVDRRIGVDPVWAVGSGVAFVGSGVLYALAAASAGSFAEPDPSVALEDLERRRRSTNSLVLGSGLAAGLGLGGFVGAVVVGSR